MNPLSPVTYYRRHKRQTALLLTLIALMTLGVNVMVRLPDSFLEHMAYSESIVTRVNVISPLGRALDPGLVAQISAHPGVERVIQEQGLYISLPPISGSYRFTGVQEDDVQTLLDACDLRLEEGRLPTPRRNEIVLAESIALGTNKWIDDQIGGWPVQDDETWFAAIPVPLTVVGILKEIPGQDRPSPPVGIVSYEFVNSHEAFTPRWRSGLLVIAHEGHKPAVEAFLEAQIAPYADVKTQYQLEAKLERMSRNFYLLFGVVDILVALAIALVVSIINQLAQSKRLSEFGMLNAMGLDRRYLIRRLALETAVVALIGWVLGLALSWGFFYLLKTTLYEPNGIHLRLDNLTPIWFSLPIPWAAVAFAVWNAARTFARFDPIAIVERDKLSMEETHGPRTVRSRIRPLASTLFYLRHRRRGVALVLSIGLMLLGVTFPMFVFGPMLDAWSTILAHLEQTSVVSPTSHTALDPGIVAQIRNHDTVQDVIPAIPLEIEIDVPPMAHPSVSIYGVAEHDLPALLDTYGVRLEEGRLPQPRTNEVMLSRGLAQNRGLRVGDRFGRLFNPQEDDDIPEEMVVVGILSARPDDQDLWTGFASLEYLSRHESYALRPLQLLIVPAQGRKNEMDAWLIENIDSNQAAVLAFDQIYQAQQIGMYALLVVFGILEGVIAVVAAVALAILSYTFFVQRKTEFGILHAIGHMRRKLIWRTLGETVSVVGIAWVLGAGLCIIGLVGMQVWLYTPKGFTLNIFNPAPWLFTVPLPVATIAVGTIAIARMLRRLDPVTVIEKR